MRITQNPNCNLRKRQINWMQFVAHHRLRLSVSPVLSGRRLFLSMGNGKFRPPQNRHPSTDYQNICQRWLRRRPLRLCKIRCISVHWGLLGTWVKYNHKIIFIYALFGNSPTGQTRRRIFTHDGSNDADSRKNVPFGEFFTLFFI